MEPKNGDLEDVFPFLMGDFQVPCQISGEYILFPPRCAHGDQPHKNSRNRGLVFCIIFVADCDNIHYDIYN